MDRGGGCGGAMNRGRGGLCWCYGRGRVKGTWLGVMYCVYELQDMRKESRGFCFALVYKMT